MLELRAIFLVLLASHTRVPLVDGIASNLDVYSNVNDTSLAASITNVVLLGGILPIHPPDNNNGGVCGTVDASNLQRAEAIAFAVNKANSDPKLLPPGVKLGFYIRDSCLLLNTALDRTLDFITGSITVRNSSTLYRVSGIIGETQSTISISMASLLRLFRIPQVSPFSTAAELSNKQLYEYFLRTPPPDSYQSKALFDLVEYFNWTYIITVNSGDTYGRNGISEFIRILNSRNGTVRCIAVSIEIPFPDAAKEDFDSAAGKFVEGTAINASAVVLFGHNAIAEGLLDALKRRGVTRRLFWVGSDSWADTLKGTYPTLLGNQISVVPKTEPSTEFDDYFTRLHISNHTTNPWFAEYWQSAFNCSLSNVTNSALKPCDTTNQHISSANGYFQDSYIPLVIEAVMAFANAIRNLHTSFCNGSGLCNAILSSGDTQLRTYIPGDLLRPFLFNVTFQTESGANFSFDANGDPTSVSYTIKNLQINNGSFSYVPVGTWSNKNLSAPLRFTEKVVWNNYQGSVASRCSDPCIPGQYRQYLSNCCWKCANCMGDKDYSDGSSTTCSQCNESFASNQFRNGCIPIHSTYYHIALPGAVVILTAACLGIVATVFVTIVFIVHFRNKIIKATGRELTSFLLVGILLSYVVPFLFVIKPSPAICGIRWVGVGLSFSMCFSALLVRTVRIHRIFNRPLSTKAPLFVGSFSQSLFTVALIGVQVVIMAVWLAAERPGAINRYSATSGELRCTQSPYSSFSVITGYNCLLLAATTYFAFRTRNVPKNFNETKFINLTVYSLVMIWIVLLPTYFGTAGLGERYRTTSLLLTIVLSGTVILGAILLPRVIYLFRNVYGDLKSPDTTAAVDNYPMKDFSKQVQLGQQVAKQRASQDLENAFCEREKILCDSSTQTENE